MEHILLPQGASYAPEEMRIPYLGSTDYLGVPFTEYPKLVGFDIVIEGKKDGDEAGVDWIALYQLRKKITPGFLQTWLFCGFLQEFLGSFLQGLNLGENLYRHEDFVVKEGDVISGALSAIEDTCILDQTDLPYETITTAKLEQLFDRWTELVRPQLVRAEEQYIHLALRVIPVAQEMLRWERNNPVLPLNVKQNICTVCDAVSLWLNFCTDDTSYQRLRPVKFEAKSIFTAERASKMQILGWCPYQSSAPATERWGQSLYRYLEKLDKRKGVSRQFRHQQCQLTKCNAKLPPAGSHHRDPLCTCEELKIEGAQRENMLSILKNGTIPLLQLKEIGGQMTVSIVPNGEHVRYTAISHVWMDGLGNTDENALRVCQVKYLYDRIQEVPGQSTTNSHGLHIWLDTMCCPANAKEERALAIKLMRETYMKAKTVLALDAELEATNIDGLDLVEIMARIVSSTWAQRLWTLQEAFFAQELYVQFSSGPVSLDILALLSAEIIKAPSRDASVVRGRDGLVSLALGLRASRTLCSPPTVKDLAIRRKLTAFMVGMRSSDARSQETLLPFTVPGRAVTKPKDEGICLSTLLDLPIERLVDTSAEEQMRLFWIHLSEKKERIPRRVIFGKQPRLNTKGLSWAPSTVLDWDAGGYMVADGGVLGLSSEGLTFTYPGYRLTSVTLAPGHRIQRSYFRDDHNAWFEVLLRCCGEQKQEPYKCDSESSTCAAPVSDSCSEYAIIQLSHPEMEIAHSDAALLVQVVDNRDGILFVKRMSALSTGPAVLPLEEYYRFASKIFCGPELPDDETMLMAVFEFLRDNPRLAECMSVPYDPSEALRLARHYWQDAGFGFCQRLPPSQVWCME